MERISSKDASTEAMLARLKEQVKAAREASKNRQSDDLLFGAGKKKINLTTYMIRIANARTTIQVDGVIRSVQAEARSMKGKGADNMEIASARRVARKVKEKGTVKIFRLRKEERLRLLSELQKSANNMPKAEETLQLLKKKRRARKAEERIDVVKSLKSDKAEDACYASTQTQPVSTMANGETAVTVEIDGMEVSFADAAMPNAGGVDYLL